MKHGYFPSIMEFIIEYFENRTEKMCIVIISPPTLKFNLIFNLLFLNICKNDEILKNSGCSINIILSGMDENNN